ncbi:carbohydrate kinase [Pelosinus sp. UFO1]|uniref:carbohydrate kinase family protein n=1 Tax=Pelosinus sp. UFO1 TaxID=484770 RepID=UPI0004D1CE3D|nr:carbohydrate kinase [Pelosinus sp. UFO1]AIF50883.1 Fructokinase [Pelosinus sp. UFO1]
MFDVVALGELLIDFTPIPLSFDGKLQFQQNPGGAPANVLAALTKLGGKSAFIGMVGQDQFGLFLKDVLVQNNINVTGLKVSPRAHTTLAFVHLDSSGDRSFSFYRNPGADMLLGSQDVDYEILAKAKIFHFGSLSMTDEPVRSATLAAVQFAREKKLIISYDPNFRPALWPSTKEAITHMKVGLTYADIVKISDEELKMITGKDDIVEGASTLYQAGNKIVLVTLGAEGCYYQYPGGQGRLLSYPVKPVDTTGAGDAFLGAFLYQLGDRSLAEISSLPQKQFEDLIDFANAAGGLTTTKAGAIPALPSLKDINDLRRGMQFYQ